MKTVDIILLVILLFAGYKGYTKGFLMELVSILALVLAIVGGFRLLHAGMDFLDEKFDINGTLLPYISFILIFILILVLVNFIGKSVKKVLDMTLLGSFDNIMGSLISIVKWAFGISVVIWLSASFNLGPGPEHTEGSLLYPLVADFAPWVLNGFSSVLPFLKDMFQNITDLLRPTE